MPSHQNAAMTTARVRADFVAEANREVGRRRMAGDRKSSIGTVLSEWIAAGAPLNRTSST